MNSRRIVNEEVAAVSLRKSIMDLDRLACKQHRLKFRRKLKDSKLKMIATDSIIRKVYDGELEISQIKAELRGTIQEHKKSTKNFIRQLELLIRPDPPVPLQREIFVAPDVPEEERKILLFNKKKQIDNLNKDARLLMDIIFGKKITHEHNKFLRKEYHKTRSHPRSPMINYNMYM